ncbi:PQQ-binding-like beta-propeller repeat protein [uncultured Winogradskyella sp.]|uniref:PQQ-binding-like beta-propeller repeat protein n=1 Tax=uncultured Winogradskyella sp. TaxID=395353 RepID=UPI00260CF08A|nr:PQQ-binding-like beta-propeller repeat protein [uncultured Winogradskyella sp.]
MKTQIEILKNGSPSEIEKLFKDGLDPNQFWGLTTPFLMVSGYNPNPDAIDVCIKYKGIFYYDLNGIEWTEADHEKEHAPSTFIHACMYNSNPKVLQRLIAHGDNPNVLKDNQKRDNNEQLKHNGFFEYNGLMLASKYNPNIEIHDYLITSKLYKVNKTGWSMSDGEIFSALTLAAGYNTNPEVIKLLMLNKAKLVAKHMYNHNHTHALGQLKKNRHLNSDKALFNWIVSFTPKRIRDYQKEVKSKATDGPRTKTKKEVKVQHNTLPESKVAVPTIDASLPISQHHRSDYHRTSAYNSDAEVLEVMWLEKLPFKFKYMTPVAKDTIVLSGDYGGVALFDTHTKEVVWRYEGEYWHNRPPIVYKDLICVPTEGFDSLAVYLLEIKTGKLIKRIAFPGGSNSNLTSPVLVGDFLYLFNRAHINVFDLSQQKLVHKLMYFGKTQEGRTEQEPIFHDNKFWVFTKKRKKEYLEGIGIDGNSVHFELPTFIEMDEEAEYYSICYNDTIYFHTASGHVLGIHTQTGKVMLDINLYDEIEDIQEQTIRYSYPSLKGNLLVIFSECLNEKEGIYCIDLDTQKITSFIDLNGLGFWGGGDTNILVGKNHMYAIGGRHIVRFNTSEVQECITIDENLIHSSLDDDTILDNGTIYINATYNSGTAGYCNEVISIGKSKTPQLDAFEKVNLNVFKAEQLRQEALSLRDIDQKLELLNRVIALDPNNKHAHNDRGFYYRGLKKYDLAIADFDKQISLYPDRSYAYACRAYVNIDLDRPREETYTYFEKAIELKTSEQDVYLQYAEYMLLDCNYEKVLEIIKKLKVILTPRSKYEKIEIEKETEVLSLYLECMALYMLDQEYKVVEQKLKNKLNGQVETWDFQDIMSWYQSAPITKAQKEFLSTITSKLTEYK